MTKLVQRMDISEIWLHSPIDAFQFSRIFFGISSAWPRYHFFLAGIVYTLPASSIIHSHQMLHIFDNLPQFLHLPLIHRSFHIVFLQICHLNTFCLAISTYLKAINLDSQAECKCAEWSYHIMICFHNLYCRYPRNKDPIGI